MIYKLNLLNGLSIGLSLLFQLALLKLFGANIQTDFYFLSLSIIQFVSGLVIGSVTDFFIPFYTDTQKSSQDSAKFVGGLFVLMFLVNVIFAAAIFYFGPYLVKVFASGYSFEVIRDNISVLKILSFSLVSSGLSALMIATLNAHLNFKFGYLMNALERAIPLLTLLVIFNHPNIVIVSFSLTISSVLVCLITYIYLIKNVDFQLANPFLIPGLFPMLKKNLTMRIGTSLYQIQGPITTNFVSFLPPGTLALMNYAYRILGVVSNFANSPTIKVYYSKICLWLADKRYRQISEITYSTINNNNFLFILFLIPIMVLFNPILKGLLHQNFSVQDMSQLYKLFIMYIPFFIIMTIELPFTYIAMANKDSLNMLKINVRFILVYLVVLLLSFNRLGVYSIGLAMAIGQLHNLASFAWISKKVIDLRVNHLRDLMIFYSVIAMLLVLINYYLANLFELKLLANIVLLILIVLVVIRKDRNFLKMMFRQDVK